MALPPCHTFIQFYVTKDGFLDCQLYQRSGDVFLGIPFNIASYALLTYIIAKLTNLKPGTFVHTIGDAHIYENHIPQVKLQIKRKPRKLPKLVIRGEWSSIEDINYDDFVIENYNPHPHIKGDVAV